MTDEAELDRRYGLSPFEVDGVDFVPGYHAPESPTSFVITKSHVMIDHYRALLPEYHKGRIVELGIWRGGSVALLALLAEPSKMVSLDLTAERITHLDDFLSARGLETSIRPMYGIDQGDTERISEILAAEFGGAPLDMVVDDASHLYQPSLASFELLFGHLRPGGVYVIEDWNCDHLVVGSMDAEKLEAAREAAGSDADAHVPLSRLVVELLLLRALPGDIVRSVEISEHFVTVRRGDDPLPADGFRVAGLYSDPFSNLPPVG